MIMLVNIRVSVNNSRHAILCSSKLAILDFRKIVNVYSNTKLGIIQWIDKLTLYRSMVSTCVLPELSKEIVKFLQCECMGTRCCGLQAWREAVRS